MAGAICLLGLAVAVPAFAQPPLVLPASLDLCPNGGNPCVTVSYPHIENDYILNQVQPWGQTFQAELGRNPDPTPVFGPAEYFNLHLEGLGTGYSIGNGDYVAWSTHSSDSPLTTIGYLLFNTYVKLPPYPWVNYGQQYAAVNWLINHKPTSVAYQTGCDRSGNNCTGTGTATDARTIRDVVQQVIWGLFNNGTPYCCSLLDPPDAPPHPRTPTMPQYNASWDSDGTIYLGGGYNITSAVASLYKQAMAHTDFVPGTQDIFGLFALDSIGIIVEIPPKPVLQVVKSPKGGIFTQGSQVSFTIVVSNPGAAGNPSATNVQLTDTLPTNGGLTWTTVTTTQGTCAITNNALSCSLGTIAPQGSVTVTVSSPTTTPAAACQLQPNGQPGQPGAFATADNGLSVSDYGSLICTQTLTSQLNLVKTGGTFTMGGQATFTMVLSNPASSTGTVHNAVLHDPLPTNGGLTWTSFTQTQGQPCTLSNNVLDCANLGDIAPGGSVTITVSSAATTPAAACQTQPNPGAIASASNVPPLLPVTASLNCTRPPQLQLVKTPKDGTFAIGGQTSFTLVVSNAASAGSQSATNVVVNDPLPTNGGLTWTTFTTTQGTCAITSNVLTCSLGTIAPGGSVTITVSSPTTTPVAACQSQPNQATVTADNNLFAIDSGSLNCKLPQLKVVKSPKGGAFSLDGQASFTMVVSNPAPAGYPPATNVTLSDTLPTNGGLTWTTANTTQGTCTITSNVLSCSLGTIPAQGSVTVTVLSPSTTPDSACQLQPNPAANAAADLGLKATDSGSLNCYPPPPPPPECGPFLVRYAANLNAGESYITIGNDGSNGTPLLGPGLGGASGNICVNVYAFDAEEEMVSCCSCLVTPDQVRYMRVKQDLVSNLVWGVSPTSVTVKLLSTLAGTGGSGTSCANSAATVDRATIVPGMLAWGTTLHATPVAGTYATTETPYGCATLSQGELLSLANRCGGIVGELSGFGICGPCRPLP